jgi:hypothetical protein
LRLQFDRPLAPDTRLYARLAGPRSVWGSFYDDSNSLVPYVEGIAADVSIHGAAVLIRPRQALQWGGMYSLQIDTRSTAIPPACNCATPRVPPRSICCRR